MLFIRHLSTEHDKYVHNINNNGLYTFVFDVRHKHVVVGQRVYVIDPQQL